MLLGKSKVESSLAFKNPLSVSNSDTQEFSLSSSFIEPSLAFENTQSVSNSDTQEFSLSSSTVTTTILLEIVNSWILICKTEVENYDIRYTVKWCKKIKRKKRAASQKCSSEKMFWKYAANLQEKTDAEVRF